MVSVGELKINTPVIIAPMAGVTDFPFRQILREYGAELCFTEMVSSQGLIQGNRRTEKLLDFSRNGGKIGVQLFGSEPEYMARAASMVEEIFSPDLIDINMCCPAPKVTKTGAGATLLQNPELAVEIVEKVNKFCSLPITAKMRKGWKTDEKTCVKLGEKLQSAGLKGVAIHARSREDYYEGEADWKVIAETVKRLDIPVAGSGDVFSAEAAERMLAETNCDAVLLARGIQGNPWLIKKTRSRLEQGEKLPDPEVEEKINQALEHLDRAVDYYGESRAVPLMRKHISWYLKGLPYCTEIKEKINHIGKREEVIKELNDYLEKIKNNF